MVDVTVQWEYDFNSLAKAASDKVEYYENLEDQVKDHAKTDTVHFFGFPVRARGKWRTANNMILQLLGMSGQRIRQTGKLFSWQALFYSLNILALFGGSSYTETTNDGRHSQMRTLGHADITSVQGAFKTL